MALQKEFELMGAPIPNSYWRVSRVGCDNVSKTVVVAVHLYYDKETRKEKGELAQMEVVFANKPGTPLNSAFLEDGTMKPDMQPEDRHVKPVNDYTEFMATKAKDIYAQAYINLKKLPEFKDALDA